METQNPKISIGLPVFNGEKYLKQAIDSILAQTFQDFELIICDNASTDRSEEICRFYADRDPRVRYYRNPVNIGGSRNQNLTIELARGQYFHIGADDDLLAPDLFAKCIEVLDQNPSLVLCYSMMFEIDEQGQNVGRLEPEELATSEKPEERFFDLLKPHRVDFLYGLIRTDALRKTELEPSYPEADLVFACELGFYGRFHRIPEYLFYRRIHGAAFTNLDFYNKLVWSQPTIQNTPGWLIPWIKYYSFFVLLGLEGSHLIRIIGRAPLKLSTRIFCYLHSGKWLAQKFLLTPSWSVRQQLRLNRSLGRPISG